MTPANLIYKENLYSIVLSITSHPLLVFHLISTNEFGTLLICDTIKQNESELARYSQTKPTLSLFFIVFAITQNAISRESIAQSSLCFCQIKA